MYCVISSTLGDRFNIKNGELDFLNKKLAFYDFSRVEVGRRGRAGGHWLESADLSCVFSKGVQINSEPNSIIVDILVKCSFL